MNIGLIQIDGKIPNLALMKLAAWHKLKGNKVTLMKDNTICTRLINFDLVYISAIFEKNKETAIELKKQFKRAIVGGIGVNNKRLLPYIEHIKPDYELFNCGYSIGYTTRGCIRHCKFCKVPVCEGLIRPNADIYEFWDKKHKHIMLLDNNILACPEHFKIIASQILKERLTVDFNQGLDIRLINNENAKLLKKLRVKPCYRFAFDDISIKKEVIKGIKILKANGINQALFYVLVGFNSTFKEDLERLDILKKLGQRAYIMRYKTVLNNTTYTNLAAWANQPALFIGYDYTTFLKKRNPKANKII